MGGCVTYHPNVIPLLSTRQVSAAAYMEVAGEPGGDFYDYYLHPDGKISFLIGDVSGKGWKAAQYMHYTLNAFRELIKDNPSATELIHQLNKRVSSAFDRLHFVTLTYVQINQTGKYFSYVRAGHCPLLYYSAPKHTCNFLDDKGLGLGIIRNNVFSANLYEYYIEWEKNDLLILYTDGLTETEDKDTGRIFCPELLCQTVLHTQSQPPVAICSSILNAFHQAVAEPRNPDDLALIVIKFAR